MTVELDKPRKAPRTVNQVVNDALQLWGKVTGAKPNNYSMSFVQTKALDGYELSKHLESLNETRDMDPTGVTTLMMLRGLVEHHLKSHMFTTYDLLVDTENCRKDLDELTSLRDMVEDPEYVEIVEGFIEQMRQAADHYGVPGGRKNKRLNELLADRFGLAYVRRDALVSIKNLEAHQFTHGDPDPTHLHYNKYVYEFWNINSMLKSLLGQGIPGISLVLIREPLALSSFFVFAIRNAYIDALAELNPLALLASGFECALVGVAERCGQPALAIYDRQKCIDILVKQGMSEEEAQEYFDFNVVGAWMGEHTPIFMYTLDLG